MGNEAKCTVRFEKQKSTGKALLETSELTFRGDFRLKIPFSAIKSIKATNGDLRVQTPDGLAIFELGEAAEKWCHKILHPKTRLEKLGIKPGAKMSLIGEFDSEFLKELTQISQSAGGNDLKAAPENIFLAANSSAELSRMTKLAKAMRGTAALWIVYPKGQRVIAENDVLTAGRKAGLKDVKVVGFSATHTALKFVVPLANR